MKRRLLTVAIGLVLSLLSSRAIAAPNLAKLTGNLADIWGLAAINATVTFQSNGGNFQGTIVPPTYFSVITDNLGNLPSSPSGPPPVHFQCSNLLQTGCDVQLPYSSRVNVSFQSASSNQSGGPYGIQICDAPTCDLGLLIKLSKDPPSVVTKIVVNGGGDYGLTAANPPDGSFGQAILQPGRVFNLQTHPICTTAPTTNDVLTWTGTQWCGSGGGGAAVVTCPGCKCDGATDDTAALQTALDLAAGNTLQLPAGHCEISTVNPTSDLTIRGMGREATFLELNADIGNGTTPTGMLQFANNQHDVVVRDLTIDGKRATYADVNNDGIFVSNNTPFATPSPTPTVGPTPTAGPTPAPTAVPGVHNLTVDNVEIKGTGGAGMIVAGPTLGGSPMVVHQGITVRNSRFYDTGYHAFASQGYVNDVKVQNNDIENWGELFANSAGITCGRYGYGCLITGNTIISDNAAATGSSAHCISIDNAYDFVVANNPAIAACVGFGIEVGFSTNGVVANNTINDTSRFGIAWDNGLNANSVSDGATTSGSGIVTSATGEFYPALNERTVTVSGCGPGGADMVSVVKSVSPTALSLRDHCAATQTSGVVITFPNTTNDVVISNNSIRNTNMSGSQAAIGSNNTSVPAAKPYTTSDFTCTATSTTISSPTITFRPWMVGDGISLTGCGTASATLNSTIVSLTNSTTAVIANAAVTTVTGTSTGSIHSDYDLSSNITVSNNVISISGGDGILANSTDGVQILGNTVRNTTLSGIMAVGSNNVQLGGNVVTYANNSATAGHAGISVNMTTTVGTAFRQTGPNAAFGNGNGSGGTDEQLYEIDSVSSLMPNFPGVLAGGLIPNLSGGTLGNATYPWATAMSSGSLQNNGHLSSFLGTGAAVTSGTGSVTSGSTDNAGEVTGCTSPCTVTFGSAFAVKPVVVCSDVTSVTACKVSSIGVSSFIATTTGTDTFDFVVIGK